MKIGLCKVAFLICFAFSSYRGMVENQLNMKKITAVPGLDQLSNNIKKLNIFSYAIRFIFPRQLSLFFLRFRKRIFLVFLKLLRIQIPYPFSSLAINILKVPIILFSAYRSHSHHAPGRNTNILFKE